jgi:hypothetical protein
MNDIEIRRAADARHHENRARLAYAYARYATEGVGSTQFEDAAEFGLTFIEKPFVSVGAEVNLDELAEALGIDEEALDIPLPHTSAFVVDWDRDERGYYVGAWCAGVVTFPQTLTLPEGFLLEVTHHLTFAGVGIKDVPLDVTT